MSELKRVIEKASNETLWELMTDATKHMNQELKASANVDDNSRFWFWYELFKALEREIDKRMVQEG